MTQAIPTVLMLVVILGGPILLSWLVARALRLPEYAWKIWLVVFSTVLAALPLVARYPDALKLGVDLSGGTILVYQVDPTQAPPEGFNMDNMVAAITQRINPAGTVDVTVRPSGEDRIEIIIPRATEDEVRRYKDIITNLGSLEFRILANQKDHGPLIRRGELSFPKPVLREVSIHLDSRLEAQLERGELPDEVRTVFVDNAMDLSENAKVLPGGQEEGGWTIADRGRTFSVTRDGDRLLARGQRIEAEWVPIAEKQQDSFGSQGQVALRTDPELGLMVLVVRQRPRDEVTGEFLRRAMRGMDQSGRPDVEFRFDTEGARRFGRLTGDNVPDRDGFVRRLAIVLSGKIYSAPSIQSQIRDQGEITGDFTVAEVDDLVRVLNAGSLPAALDVEPVMEQTIGPTLGRDTIEKGTRSIFVAMIAVLVFVLIYYLHFAGTVADICLVLNLLLVVGTMSLIDATFTLPGLAGLVLTVGMSIDANVLIFERIREEQDRGGQLRVAIRNGFARAYRTIIDSNITTLLTAFILYGIGTDQVKGFAVTLIIGILMSMFTAMFVSRLVFEIFERKGWIKRVRMLRIVGHTRIDFLAKWVPCATVSCVLIVLGVLVVGLRGSSMLDIDFTGGTAVAIRLAEPESTEEVRRLAREIPDATVEDLSVGGERPEEGRFVRFLIRTTEQDPDGVKAKIIDAFGDRLVRVRMDYGTVEEVPGDASPGGQASSETPSDSDPSTKTTATSTEALPHRFAGGSRVDLSFSEPLSTAAAKRYFAEFFATAENLATAELQIDVTGTEAAPGTDNQFVKMSLETSFASSRLDAALDQVQARLAEEPLFDRVNNFGGQVAGETTQLALFAMLASFAAIVGYLWFRFQAVTFGLAAVAALAHDVLIVLGLVALSGWLTQGPAGFVGSVLLLDPFKIDLPMIAAFLTLVGYSLNDTIVVFDRIREVRGKNPDITKDMVNVSVNQTLSRTLLTSFTTWLVVAILYVWGGEGIHGFAFCLVTGIIVGTYSSIYIASPLLVWLSSRKKSTSRAGRRSRSKKPVPVAEST